MPSTEPPRGIPMEPPFERLVACLERALAGPLPGFAAQSLLAPRPRPGWPGKTLPEGTRTGATLVLVYPLEGRAHVLLTLRGDRLLDHPGQVSLPGGAIERGETPERAALREGHEEVGLDPAEVRLLGRLTELFVPVSRFLLYPCVGVTPCRPRLRAAPGEVSRLIETDLVQLADPSMLGLEHRRLGGRPVEIPYLRVGDARIWGATAMILAELLAIIGLTPRPHEAPGRGSPRAAN